MEFALIASGPKAKAPAPRVPAVSSRTGIGVYEHATREIWQPDMVATRAALPHRWRKAFDRASGPWFQDSCNYEAGRKPLPCLPALPYMTLTGYRGKHLATVYFAPCEAPAYRFDYDRLSGTGIIVRLADDTTSLRFTGEEAQRLRTMTAQELEIEAAALEFTA